MDIGALFSGVSENWETIATVTSAVGGAYVVKVQRAVKKVKAALKEMEQTQAVVVAALKPDEDGATIIDETEAKAIAKEVQEDLVAMHAAVDAILAVLPAAIRDRIPFGTKKEEEE